MDLAQVDLVLEKLQNLYGPHKATNDTHHRLSKTEENALALKQRKSISKKPLSFIDLPGEIRNKIYGYVLVQDQGEYELRPLYMRDIGRPKSFELLGIFRCSRQVHDEAVTIFYSLNRFSFFGSPEELKDMTRLASSGIRHLSLYLEYFENPGPDILRLWLSEKGTSLRELSLDFNQFEYEIADFLPEFLCESQWCSKAKQKTFILTVGLRSQHGPKDYLCSAALVERFTHEPSDFTRNLEQLEKVELKAWCPKLIVYAFFRAFTVGRWCFKENNAWPDNFPDPEREYHDQELVWSKREEDEGCPLVSIPPHAGWDLQYEFEALSSINPSEWAAEVERRGWRF